MDDPGLVARLQKAKVTWLTIIQQASPLMKLRAVLPIGIFVVLGQYLSKNMMQRMDGTNAMRSKGKAQRQDLYQDQTGIKFEDFSRAG